jgi:ABC-type dipeptide/oligopeptide/nickel transport system permease component
MLQTLRFAYFIWLLALGVTFGILAAVYPNVGGAHVSQGFFIYGSVMAFILALALVITT